MAFSSWVPSHSICLFWGKHSKLQRLPGRKSLENSCPHKNYITNLNGHVKSCFNEHFSPDVLKDVQNLTLYQWYIIQYIR
jgi:hypothetical protein